MWPFYSRKEHQRRALLRPFSPYLSPEMIETLVRNPDALLPSVQHGLIPYIILQVRDDDLGQVPGYLDQAFEAALDSGGAILSVMSSVVAVTFGIPIRDPDSESIDQCNQAVARLLKDLGPNVRVISGRVNGLYGVLGSAHRVSFQALIPDFGKSLESLLGLEFGNSGEI
jgi:hypothetical protein